MLQQSLFLGRLQYNCLIQWTVTAAQKSPCSVYFSRCNLLLGLQNTLLHFSCIDMIVLWGGKWEINIKEIMEIVKMSLNFCGIETFYDMKKLGCSGYIHKWCFRFTFIDQKHFFISSCSVQLIRGTKYVRGKALVVDVGL